MLDYKWLVVILLPIQVLVLLGRNKMAEQQAAASELTLCFKH